MQRGFLEFVARQEFVTRVKDLLQRFDALSEDEMLERARAYLVGKKSD